MQAEGRHGGLSAGQCCYMHIIYRQSKVGGEVGRGDRRRTASSEVSSILTYTLSSLHISEIRMHFTVDGNYKLMDSNFFFLRHT